MSSQDQNLSEFDRNAMPDASGMRFSIVVAEWNSEITEALYDGAVSTLMSLGCPENNIIRKNVPGSFELPMGAKWLIETATPDAVICLGCVIQGETRHFEFICQAVSNGIMQLSMQSGIPVIFGVLTPDNYQQAMDRAGGRHGNKGVEAAQTAVRMAALREDI